MQQAGDILCRFGMEMTGYAYGDVVDPAADQAVTDLDSKSLQAGNEEAIRHSGEAEVYAIATLHLECIQEHSCCLRKIFGLQALHLACRSNHSSEGPALSHCTWSVMATGLKLSFGLKAKQKAKPALFQASDDEDTEPAVKRQRTEASPGPRQNWLLFPLRL